MSNCSADFYILGYPSTIAVILANSTIIVISIIVCCFALHKLITASIFQLSTRVFLSVSLIFIIFHILSYLAMRIQILYMQYYTICDLAVIYCYPIIIGVYGGAAGLAYIQVAMSVDRLLGACLKTSYIRHEKTTTICFVFLVLLCTFLTYRYQIEDNTLDYRVPTCQNWDDPHNRYMTITSFILYLSIFDFIADFVILLLNIKNERKIRDIYDVAKRFEARMSLKSTQAVLTISMVQFFAQATYSLIFLIFQTFFTGKLSPHASTLLVIYIYPVSYTATFHGLVILYAIRRMRIQRAIEIKKMTDHKNNLENHLQQMRASWR
ncbi:unnamed protein product [Caenorhabditis angaria]|uniref:Uncharacterized protein n=1 Tax=Caenorhabditis angaria TaxID=860376 RepID=A0A9P1ID43_9PELO|nr:unnamed protein product [Caenorhabditis angaria]